MIFCFHKWDKWSKPVGALSKVQIRRCLRCNKYQQREVNFVFGAQCLIFKPMEDGE